jgi:hypothetical protein
MHTGNIYLTIVSVLFLLIEYLGGYKKNEARQVKVFNSVIF